MSTTALLGLLAGLAAGGSLALLLAALSGWQPPKRPKRVRRGEVFWNRAAGQRLLIGLGVGLAVAVITRWPVPAITAGALIYLWPTMFGGSKEGEVAVERLEALAVWTESLRDSIAGSLGLEEAIRHTTATAPALLRPALQRMATNMDIRVSLPDALAAFAEEFKDASADLVVAALILNAHLRGKGLGDTLTRLAASTRAEVEMRHKVEEGRKALRRNAMIVIAVTVIFAGSVTLFSREYVAPYSSPTGQLVLGLVIAIFAAGLMWMRAAAAITPPERFLAGADQISEAVKSYRSAR